MPQRPKKRSLEDLIKEQNDLLRDNMIVNLGLNGVPQLKIRAIVGGDIAHVNKILKNLKKKER